MNGLDLIIEYPNAFPDNLCDEMIERFEDDDTKAPGHSGNYGPNFSKGKVSTDLFITGLPEWEDIDTKIYDILSPYIRRYVSLLSNNFFVEEISHISDQGYQIQRTDPGGFFNWHCDHTAYPILDQIILTGDNDPSVCVRDRIATYIIYLNDRTQLTEGTTEFKFGDNFKTIVPERGKLIMFPANILYPHRGVPLETGVKYIMTGWVTRDIVCRLQKSPQDYTQRFERYGELPHYTPMDNR